MVHQLMHVVSYELGIAGKPKRTHRHAVRERAIACEVQPPDPLGRGFKQSLPLLHLSQIVPHSSCLLARYHWHAQHHGQ